MRGVVAAALAVCLAAAGARAEDPPQIDLIAPVDGPIVRHFDPPSDPFSAGHRGIDFGAPFEAPVVAAAGGIVAFAGQVGGRLYVSIDHPEGLRTTYSFLARVLVETGQAVAQGDLIALSGAGHVDEPDPHLHFGLRRGSEYLDPESALLASMRRNLWRVIALTG